MALQGKRVLPSDLCESSASDSSPSSSGLNGGASSSHFDAPTAAILGLLCLGVFLVVLFSGVFLYKWHRVISARYRILRSMKVVSPVQERITYKETLVSFDKNVKVIPRPPSVFYIASEAPATSAEAIIQQPQPDLVRSVSNRRATVFRGGMRPDFDSIDEEDDRSSMKINSDIPDASNGAKMTELEELEAIERKTREMVREMSIQPQEEVVELRDADQVNVATFVSVRLDDEEE